jgi:hypothetical protein
MSTCFYQFQEPLLSEADTNDLRVLADREYDNFRNFYNQSKQVYSNNKMLSHKEDAEFEQLLPAGIKSLLQRCTLENWTMFTILEPGKLLHRHIDSPLNKRNTVIIFPLSPEENFPPTYFDNGSGKEQVATFTNNLPALINTQVTHYLINTSAVRRVTFQIGFVEPIDQVIAMIKSNTLFKKA